MNIFYLDPNPTLCAQYHCDKHVVKMILETAQILCSVSHLQGNKAPYKLTHKNHPCVKWAGSSLDNYLWLFDLGYGLCNEYEFRYRKEHKALKIIDWCSGAMFRFLTKDFTPPPLCVPEKYKTSDVVESYRQYYIGEKASFAKWTRRETPKWFKI